jgi:hypothetical protein
MNEFVLPMSEHKKWEYETVDCDPELLFDNLTKKGELGWEFVLLLTKQLMVQPKILGNNQPQILTQYVLIFKREKI